MDSHAITLHMAPKVFHFLIPAVGAFLSVVHNRKLKRHFHYAFLNIKKMQFLNITFTVAHSTCNGYSSQLMKFQLCTCPACIHIQLNIGCLCKSNNQVCSLLFPIMNSTCQQWNAPCCSGSTFFTILREFLLEQQTLLHEV